MSRAARSDGDDDDRRASARRRASRGYVLHAGLFLATFLTTTMTGAIQVHGGLVESVR